MATDSKTGERSPVPAEEAIAWLADADFIHTFRNSSPAVLIGADWPRDKLEAWMHEHSVERSGPMARGMGHALVGFDDQGPLFIEAIEPSAKLDKPQTEESEDGE